MQAVEKDKKNIAYVKGILNILDKNGVKDMGDLAEYHMEKGRV
jgi:DNA replication protein DnaD